MAFMQRRLECKVTGRVQMVMFRDFIKRAARTRGIVGTVENNSDGSVSIVAEGEEIALMELLALSKRGSLFAHVEKVEEAWSSPLGGYKNFDILY